jgi:predicted metal-dependent hydrolase
VGSSGSREHDDRGDRDRDGTGRPRNARPRDALGRPLPPGSAGVPRQPEGVLRSPDATLAEAQQLLDDGLPFHAHEVFEDAWKAAAEPDRALWKGLAQLAVGQTHAARGNRTGAARLLRRGAEHLQPYLPDSPHDIDLDGLLQWAHNHAAALESGAGEVPMPRLRRR